MDIRDRLRYVFLAIVGTFVAASGFSDDKDAMGYVGVGIVWLAILGAWWHSELERRKRERREEQPLTP